MTDGIIVHAAQSEIKLHSSARCSTKLYISISRTHSRNLTWLRIASVQQAPPHAFASTASLQLFKSGETILKQTQPTQAPPAWDLMHSGNADRPQQSRVSLRQSSRTE